MHDIIFCSVPYAELEHIYSAPAILKGVVVDQGYTSKTFDFSLNLLNMCDRDVGLLFKVQEYFIVDRAFDQWEHKDTLEAWYQEIIETLQSNPSKFIGISTISIYTQKAVYELCQRIRAAGIDSKIVVGGRGINVRTFGNISINLGIKGRDKLAKFGEILTQRNLADHVVYGDGEQAILDILKGNTPETAPQKDDTFKYPIPNYDDYRLDQYLVTNENLNFPITGSKGCVRDCDFCDVKYQFGKFRYRTGRDIANEMIALSQKHGFRKFMFTDSLVNGGLKIFEEFVTIMAEYNQHHTNHRIRWNGQYICRPASQMPRHLYPLMAMSGAEGLTIGAESGSNNVLQAMNKKTTVEALYDELEQFRLNNISCVLLTFPAHWSETWEDFIDHCKMFINVVPYVRYGTISAIYPGMPAMLLDGTPSRFDADVNQVALSTFNPEHIYFCRNNITRTYKDAIFRQLLVYQIFDKLKIPYGRKTINLTYNINILESSWEQINQFYQEELANIQVDPQQLINSKGQHYFDHFDKFIEQLLPRTHRVCLDIEVGEINNPPLNLIIDFNGEELFNQPVVKDRQIEVDIPEGKYNKLTLTVTGKGQHDTRVEDGKIVADKYIRLRKLMLANYNLTNDYEFFRENFEYYLTDTDQTTTATPGFWNNAELTLKWSNSFVNFYHTKTRSNTGLSHGIETDYDNDYHSEKLPKLLAALDRLIV